MSLKSSHLAAGLAGLGVGVAIGALAKFFTRTPVQKKKLAESKTAVIVVDPISTGANLASEILSRGYPVIRVLSRSCPESVANLVDASGELLSNFAATIEHKGDVEATIQAAKKVGFVIIAVFAGSELGVEVADELSERMGLMTNGTSLTNARRDKYEMGEQVRSAGVRAVKQHKCSTVEEVEAAAKDIASGTSEFAAIIKPVRSAGSDSVYLCRSTEELLSKFQLIVGQTNQIGQANVACLVQEYLAGQEYVVDTVSLSGVHKVAAIWAYDKRPANGQNFVYHGMQCMDASDPRYDGLISYFMKVLDSLSIKNGPSHGEVMMTSTGPCLVEVGARPHGAEGTFISIANACYGFSQVTMTADAYLDPEAFARYPERPKKANDGRLVDIVSYADGVIKSLPHLNQVKKLASFHKTLMLPKPGDKVVPTVDCFTAVGAVALIHKDEQVVTKDYETIRQLERTFFELEPKQQPQA